MLFANDLKGSKMKKKEEKQDKKAPVQENQQDKDKNYKGIIPRELIKGRPRVYKSVEAMAAKIAEYLDDRADAIIDKVVTKDGDIIEVRGQGPMSIGSLCDFLGISDETFENYGTHQDYKKFHALVGWTKQKICGYHEDTAATSGKNKADFILINRFRKVFSKDAAGPSVNVYPQILVKEISNGESAASGDGDSGDIRSASEDK